MTAHKVMLLGEIGVGKSSIVQRLVFDRFDFDYKPTIGVDIYRYDVPGREGCPATSLIVWDTDGNFGDAIFGHVYMREAASAVIVGDASRPSTIETMAMLVAGFREALPGRPATLVINKCDLCCPDTAIELPVSLTAQGRMIHRTSAKTGANIHSVFRETADVIERRKV